MLFWERRRLGECSLDETACLQEQVNLLGCGSQTCGTYAIAGQDIGFRLFPGQVFDAGLQTATTEGTERNDLLTAQIHLIQEITS